MKLNKTLVIAFITCTQFCISQTNQNIEFNFDTKYSINFKKIMSVKDTSYTYLNSNYPFYILNKENYNKLNDASKTTSTLYRIYLNSKKFRQNTLELYSQYDTLIKKQDERIELFKKSYLDLVRINKILDNQLETTIKLAEKPKKNHNGLIYGSLGGTLLGIITGVLISN